MRIDCQRPGIRRAEAFGELALGHGQDPVGAGGKAGIVGDHHDGGVLLAREIEHQVDDDGAGLLVEVAGGLVGEEQPRGGDHGAGEADALLLAAGQRRRAGDGRGRRDPPR